MRGFRDGQQIRLRGIPGGRHLGLELRRHLVDRGLKLGHAGPVVLRDFANPLRGRLALRYHDIFHGGFKDLACRVHIHQSLFHVGFRAVRQEPVQAGARHVVGSHRVAEVHVEPREPAVFRKPFLGRVQRAVSQHGYHDQNDQNADKPDDDLVFRRHGTPPRYDALETNSYCQSISAIM